MITGTRAQYQAAISRAQQLGGGKLARPVSQTPRLYRVESRTQSGASYTVLYAGKDQISCTCPAGQRNQPCWHAAAVWLRKLAEQAPDQEPDRCTGCGNPLENGVCPIEFSTMCKVA